MNQIMDTYIKAEDIHAQGIVLYICLIFLRSGNKDEIWDEKALVCVFIALNLHLCSSGT